MGAFLLRRRILIAENDKSIRALIKVLVEGLATNGNRIAQGHQTLAMIDRNEYDSILLDMRSADVPAQEASAHLQNLQPSLVGRVLVVTAEVKNSSSMDIIEKYFADHVPGSRLL